MLLVIKILDEILADDNLVWGKNLENNKQKFLVELNSEIIEELTKSRNELDRIDENELPIFKNNIQKIKKEKLLDGVGFFVVDGVCLENFSVNEKKSIFMLISKILGELLIQNIQQEKIIVIKDVGKSMKTGGRYHETKEEIGRASCRERV